METDLIITAIDELHKEANEALVQQDIEAYITIFDDALQFTMFNGIVLNKRDYFYDVSRYFRSLKSFETSYYRIKSSYEGAIFTEKIARKSVIIKPKLFLFSKRDTIQTEEIYYWKNMNNTWKVIAVEVVLEERY